MGVGKYYTPRGPTAGGLPPQANAALVDVSGVPELAAAPAFHPASGELSAGAAQTLEALRSALAAAAEAPLSDGRGGGPPWASEQRGGAAAPAAAALARHLGRVATTQVRAEGSWAASLRDTSEALPRHFRDNSETLPRHVRGTSEALPRHLPQVRAVGSWAGNLALAAAHPALPSDVAVLLVGVGASLTVIDRTGLRRGGGGGGLRTVSVSEYRCLGLAPRPTPPLHSPHSCC